MCHGLRLSPSLTRHDLVTVRRPFEPKSPEQAQSISEFVTRLSPGAPNIFPCYLSWTLHYSLQRHKIHFQQCQHPQESDLAKMSPPASDIRGKRPQSGRDGSANVIATLAYKMILQVSPPHSNTRRNNTHLLLSLPSRTLNRLSRRLPPSPPSHQTLSPSRPLLTNSLPLSSHVASACGPPRGSDNASTARS